MLLNAEFISHVNCCLKM